jgi:predicted transcriptional regulator
MSSSSLNELVLAIDTLNDNSAIVDINNITSNGSNLNKDYISSLIKVLKDIGWLAKDKNGKYIRTMKIDMYDSST